MPASVSPDSPPGVRSLKGRTAPQPEIATSRSIGPGGICGASRSTRASIVAAPSPSSSIRVCVIEKERSDSASIRVQCPRRASGSTRIAPIASAIGVISASRRAALHSVSSSERQAAAPSQSPRASAWRSWWSSARARASKALRSRRRGARVGTSSRSPGSGSPGATRLSHSSMRLESIRGAIRGRWPFHHWQALSCHRCPDGCEPAVDREGVCVLDK